jgi:hypothetical protein
VNSAENGLSPTAFFALTLKIYGFPDVRSGIVAWKTEEDVVE